MTTVRLIASFSTMFIIAGCAADEVSDDPFADDGKADEVEPLVLEDVSADPLLRNAAVAGRYHREHELAALNASDTVQMFCAATRRDPKAPYECFVNVVAHEDEYYAIDRGFTTPPTDVKIVGTPGCRGCINNDKTTLTWSGRTVDPDGREVDETYTATVDWEYDGSLVAERFTVELACAGSGGAACDAKLAEIAERDWLSTWWKASRVELVQTARFSEESGFHDYQVRLFTVYGEQSAGGWGFPKMMTFVAVQPVVPGSGPSKILRVASRFELRRGAVTEEAPQELKITLDGANAVIVWRGVTRMQELGRAGDRRQARTYGVMLDLSGSPDAPMVDTDVASRLRRWLPER